MNLRPRKQHAITEYPNSADDNLWRGAAVRTRTYHRSQSTESVSDGIALSAVVSGLPWAES